MHTALITQLCPMDILRTSCRDIQDVHKTFECGTVDVHWTSVGRTNVPLEDQLGTTLSDVPGTTIKYLNHTVFLIKHYGGHP